MTSSPTRSGPTDSAEPTNADAGPPRPVGPTGAVEHAGGSGADTDSLSRLNAAWDGFFGAIRRAKGRASVQHGTELTLPQLHLLEPLADGGSARIGELAEAAGVAAPTASRMIDSLEREGLVSRSHATDDRRAIAAALTDRGRELYARKRAEIQAKRNGMFGSLSETEREQAAHLLGRMAELIDEL